MAVVQYYNIKYPFTAQGDEKFFVDLNTTLQESIKSDIMHVIFTPKGQRVRNPNFGTNLIRFIFEPSDDVSWSNVKEEVKSAVTTYIPNVNITDINIFRRDDDSHGIYVSIQYTIKQGNYQTSDTIITQL